MIRFIAVIESGIHVVMWVGLTGENAGFGKGELRGGRVFR